MVKRGQTTIFIIMGIILVGLILLFFLFRTSIIEKSPISFTGEKDSNSFLENCMKESVEKSIEILLDSGGYISNNLSLSFKTEDQKEYFNISYLCYNTNNYKPCINQEPVLMEHLKQEIYNFNSEKLSQCLQELQKDLEDSGYLVNINYRDFEIKLAPKKVQFLIDAKLEIEKAGEKRTEENFGFEIDSSLYETAKVVQEIVSQEARFCYFDLGGYMKVYPEFKIEKIETSDLSTIYFVTNKQTEEEFKFAVRSCAIPGGF